MGSPAVNADQPTTAYQKKLWQEREDKKQAALDRGDILDKEAWAKSYGIKDPSLNAYSKYLKENNCCLPHKKFQSYLLINLYQGFLILKSNL